MDIKRNKHKQELREDPVMSWVLNAKERIQKNQSKAIGAVAVVVVLFGAFLTIKQVRESYQKKAISSFGNAMIAYHDKNYEKAIELFSATVENHGSSPQAIFSSYLLGSVCFEQKKYQEAIDWFKKAVSAKKAAQFVSGQALEGISASYENLGQTDEAIKYLEEALNDTRVKHRHAAIKWKIALLSRSKDVEKTRQLCREIMADTAAGEYHQKAGNLLTAYQMNTNG